MQRYPKGMLARFIIIMMLLGFPTAGCTLAKSLGIRIDDTIPVTEKMRRDARAAGYLDEAMQGFHNGRFLDPESALPLLEQAAETNPELFDAYLYQGLAHAQMEQWPEARPPLKTAVKMRPHNIQATYLLGFAHWKLGDTDAAIESMTQCIELDSSYVDAYVQRGYFYGQQKRFEEAVEDYSQAIAMAPNRFDAYFNKGLAHFAQHQFQLAADEFTNAMAINPNSAEAFAGRGESFLRLGQFDRAREDLAQAARSNRSNPKILELLAHAQAGAKDYSAAVVTLEKAIILARTAKDTKHEERLRTLKDQYISQSLQQPIL